MVWAVPDGSVNNRALVEVEGWRVRVRCFGLDGPAMGECEVVSGDRSSYSSPDIWSPCLVVGGYDDIGKRGVRWVVVKQSLIPCPIASSSTGDFGSRGWVVGGVPLVVVEWCHKGLGGLQDGSFGFGFGFATHQ